MSVSAWPCFTVGVRVFSVTSVPLTATAPLMVNDVPSAAVSVSLPRRQAPP